MVLLGPVGSGKTYALDSIEADMSWGVIRARFDFGDQPEGVAPTTNEVLIRLVFTLSQRWRNRAKPRFPRFAVSLIAIQAELDRNSHDVAKAQMDGLIEDFRAASGEAAMRSVVNRIADGAEAANLLDPTVTALIKDLFPAVISPVRWRLRKAMRSLVDFPQAMGGDVSDALVTLNGLSPVLQTERLLQAFLADVRENHKRMSRPELGSPCKCGDAKRRKHVHNWAILLDDVDEPGGMQFLADLANARGQLAKDVHDPLLVIATIGRWDGAFTGWLPLWKSASDKPALRPLAELKNADHDYWANADSPYYPVMLDPLRLDEVARILGTGNETPEAMVVWRATQGLPLAVKHLAEHRGDRRLECGAGGVLDIYDQSCSMLKALRLPDRLGDFQIEDFITAAPFATAPWLIPVHADARTTEPRVGAILTELRTSLWVRALPKRVALHPWIATSLVYALNRRGSYVDQFAALRDDLDTSRDPVHLAFVRLALGEVGEVVTYFQQQFDKIQHEVFLDQLRLVVRAPGDLPLSDSCVTLLERIVGQYEADQTEHDEIRNNIARLVVANWLSANRFSLRDPALDKTSANALRNLASKSRRGDVQALVEAAEQAERGRLIGD